MSSCKSFGFVELQIWLIYSATTCMSRIIENAWMLGYFACLLLSVIQVLGDLSDVKCLCVFSVTLYLPWLVCDASSIAFPYIHTLASHLGTLDAPREGRDVELTIRWCWWTYLGDGRIVQVLEWGNARQASFIWQTLTWVGS
jgi:hypothetical protein